MGYAHPPPSHSRSICMYVRRTSPQQDTSPAAKPIELTADDQTSHRRPKSRVRQPSPHRAISMGWNMWPLIGEIVPRPLGSSVSDIPRGVTAMCCLYEENVSTQSTAPQCPPVGSPPIPSCPCPAPMVGVYEENASPSVATQPQPRSVLHRVPANPRHCPPSPWSTARGLL